LSIKSKLVEYQKFKAESTFLGRRDKMIRGGWRHGITGVEDPSDNPSVFYQEKLLEKRKEQQEKDIINSRRLKGKSCGSNFVRNRPWPWD